MPSKEQIAAGHRPVRNTRIRTLIPTPQELAALEPDVTVRATAAGVEYVRTPDACFDKLADFPYQPKYVDIDGLRMAYIDEGPRDAQTLLLMHGQPVWGYLYRRMIPILLAAGHRVVVPDMMGMGRSDKPIDQRYHDYYTHVGNFETFLKKLELKDISLLCQDWGSVIALLVVAEQPALFSRVLLTNGVMVGFVLNPFSIPEPVELDRAAPDIIQGLFVPHLADPFPVMFQAWINYTLTAGDSWDPGQFLALNCTAGGRPLSPQEEQAYRAPFPSLIYKAGPRTLPSMVCGIGPRNLAGWSKLMAFTGPFLHVRGSRDTQFGTIELQELHTSLIPGAQGQPHGMLDAGHFIQDNKGEELAEIFNRFIAS